MCDSDTREQNRRMNAVKPMVELPHVWIELPLAKLNDFYVDINQARRVLREGNPEQRNQLALRMLDALSLNMNEASGGFLTARNV